MKHAGEITITNPGRDRPIATVPTLQCVHCGRHFPLSPGSGRIRGFCQRCNGPICGPGCAECVPQERQLENVEAGRPVLTTRPLVLSVPTMPPFFRR